MDCYENHRDTARVIFRYHRYLAASKHQYFSSGHGAQTDLWLVKTVGLLVTVVGFVILLAGIHGSVTFEIFILAVGSASALAAVDVNYSLNRTISRIYLLDAVAEFALILLWIRAWFSV